MATISTWLVVALTIDRFILTKIPTKARTWSTPKRAYIVTGLIVVLSVAVNGPYIYEINEVPVHIDECTGYWEIPMSVSTVDNSTQVSSRYLPGFKLAITITSVLVLYVVPTIVMVLCNILITRSLRSSRFSGQVSQRRLAESRLTKMIVVVSVCFIICNLPNTVTFILWGVLPIHIVASIQPVAHLFLMINVAANIVIYAMFNRHLFTTVNNLCSKCCSTCGCMKPIVDENLTSSGNSKSLHTTST